MTEDDLRAAIDDPDLRAEIPARTLAEALLRRITDVQPTLNALLTVTSDVARLDAARVDQARATGRRLPLDGLPVVVKDNIDVAGVVTTVGSKVYRDRVATEDAEVVRRLRGAGAVVLGKAHLHEFAYGATCNSAFFGPCRNPWDLTRIPGGSSGGSGAALAADLCIAALGTDTGGSIRIPAALNGITGLRPTYGSVSTRGTVPSAWSFDTIGPMARSAEDVTHVFAALAGYDPDDPRAVRVKRCEPLRELEQSIDGLRIGVPHEFFFQDLDSELSKAVTAGLEDFVAAGCVPQNLVLPDMNALLDAFTIISRVDTLAYHQEPYRHQTDDIGEDVVRRLALGESILGLDYALMMQRMYEWRRTLQRIFSQVDIILTPTTATTAPCLNDAEMIATTATLTRFTYPWSVGQVPALSIPCGFTDNNLPIGMQLVAAPGNESLLLRTARVYQQMTQWHRRRPATPLS